MPVNDPNFALYPAVRTRIPALVGRVDGFYDEEHRLDLDTTEYPVESGGTLTDNAVKRRERLRLDGLTSDLLPAPGNESSPDRAADAWNSIVELFKQRIPVTVYTSLRTYENMLVVRAVAQVNKRTGKALQFSMNLAEILFTDTDITRFTPDTVDPNRPAGDRTSQVDAGDKVSEALTFNLLGGGADA